MRFGIPAALLAVIALALPALASADPLGSLSLYNSGLRSTARIFGDTAGPDGNVWFVDNKLSSGIPAIGRVKPAGEITEFVSGTNLSGLKAGSDPVAIATGSDGKLWFTDKGTTPAIGVIDPASPETATEFSILEKGGNAGSVPQGIVAFGGKLWFTDRGTTRAIGSIDPTTHAVEEFSIAAEGGNAGSVPTGIIASGGKLWFTDGGTTRAIGSFDPSAPATERVKEFATGANSEPGGTNASLGGWGIAAGADGNVWFTENGTNATEGRSAKGKAIGRITPSGTITYFQEGLIASSKPAGLTAADGKLWFTDGGLVNEKQKVTIEDSGTLGGTYKLGFGGKETGWTGEGTREAPVLGEGNVLRTSGGKGTWVEGSKTITIKTKPAGNYTVGELFQSAAPFSAEFGATITACTPNCSSAEVESLTVSKAATSTHATEVGIIAGGVEVTSGGPFEVGQPLVAAGVEEGATIVAITGSVLALSVNPEEAGTGVSLTSGGSTTLTGVTTSTGKLSNGLEVSGTGIAAGTTIESFSEGEGTITLSQFPTSSGTSSLSADLSFSAENSVVKKALEKLSSIGAGNVTVEFDESTTSPVTRTAIFQGALGGTDVELMSCNGAGLTGTSPTCTVETTVTAVPNGVGRITKSGEITRYPESGLLFWSVQGITAGPDGNLWLPTGATTHTQIGKFGIAGSTNRRTLTLTKSPSPDAGTGTGTVTSKPKGVKCAANCTGAEASIYKNTLVVLKAKASSGSTLSGWSGCESETTISATEGTCTVTMSTDQAVEAQFGGTSKPIAEALSLSFAKEGEGFGTVKSKPGGIGCEADCTATAALFQTGKVVVLTAVSAPGSEFAGWSGCDAEPAGNCEVTMSGVKAVTATFNALPKNPLTVAKSPSPDLGTGTGAVTSKPKAVNCPANCSEASASLPEDALVVLKGKASSGSTLSGWTGCESTTTISATEGTCTVSMATAQEVTTQFGGTSKAIASPQALNLAKAGSGFGTVKSKPGGIACEAACESASALYLTGKVVVLTGTPAAGSQPVAWSGCDEVTGENTCVVTMSGTKNVTATFDELE